MKDDPFITLPLPVRKGPPSAATLARIKAREERYLALFEQYVKDGRIFYYENRMLRMKIPVLICEMHTVFHFIDILRHTPQGPNCYLQTDLGKSHSSLLEIDGNGQQVIVLNRAYIREYKTLVPHECAHVALRALLMTKIDCGIFEAFGSGEMLATLVGDMSGFIIGKVEEFLANEERRQAEAKESAPTEPKESSLVEVFEDYSPPSA